MVEKISHIGIAVTSLEAQIPFYRDVLGLEFLGLETVEDQKVKTAMFKVGDTRIELLEPTAEDSPIAKFLEKRGQGIHHIAYQVDDCRKAVQRMEATGVQMIDKEPRRGAGGHTIAFAHPKYTFGILTELTQEH
ncbi:MAG: methylmalonyl-CoA epimerase [Candidatus Neomarinimicrobiota bacterium]|jgi:methylmalonyl-CoA/ethylmalonyl-CoA epimerase|nr:methylmalonyl-CoA epimerase [Candidatus Neomarinimicrobiota bacterium]MDX9780688.1 methylmalonyl-CoA epimerase [bacterium]